MLPLTFEHCPLTTSSEKLTSKWFGRVSYLFSILSKQRFFVNRQRYNQVGFHLTLLLLPAIHLEVLIGANLCAPVAQPQPAAALSSGRSRYFRQAIAVVLVEACRSMPRRSTLFR